KSQITAPGYQLLGGMDVPSHVDPKRLLGDAPWVTPVTDDTSNVGLRFKYNIDDNWNVSLGANRYLLKRDDHSAFPGGCNYVPKKGATPESGLATGFCGNGDYDIYDYRSDDERHEIIGTQALLQGKLVTGKIKHDLTFGLETMRRKDSFGEPVYAKVTGLGNIYGSRPPTLERTS